MHKQSEFVMRSLVMHWPLHQNQAGHSSALQSWHSCGTLLDDSVPMNESELLVDSSYWVFPNNLTNHHWLMNYESLICCTNQYQDMVLPHETPRNANETWLKVHLSGLSAIMSECTCTTFGSQTTQQLEKNTILPLASSNPDVLVFGIDNGPRWRYVKQWNMLLAMFLLHKWSILRRWTERWCVWQGIQKWNEKVFDYRFLSRVLMGKTGLKRLCSSVPTYFVLNKNPTNILFIIPRYNLWSLAICFSAFCPEANFWLGLKLVALP